MAQNIVGKLPDFTDDTSGKEQEAEVKPEEQATDSPEKETPEPPEEKPGSVATDDTPEPEEPQKAIQKLQEERAKLLKEIKELRGTKREIKQEKLAEVEQHLDDLKDLHPDDVQLIDRVLRSKGYMTKDEAGKMFYQAVQQEELDKFLNKFPEYKPENDPDNIHWGAFQSQIKKEQEFGYALPKNPHLIGAFLERVHGEVNKGIRRDSSAPTARRLAVAGVGSGGTQQSSSPKRLDADKRQLLLRGGWSEEEILKIEQKLPD